MTAGVRLVADQPSARRQNPASAAGSHASTTTATGSIGIPVSRAMPVDYPVGRREPACTIPGSGYPVAMTDTGQHPEAADRPVPGVGGAPESSADGQQGLRLHAGIAAVATVLCVGVTVVFAGMGSWVLAAVFALVAVASLAAGVWAVRHRRRGARLRRQRAAG